MSLRSCGNVCAGELDGNGMLIGLPATLTVARVIGLAVGKFEEALRLPFKTPSPL